MADDLPYRAEYAKSGRASCKGCKSPIPKDTLRLAVMVQSAFHDGKQPNWFHMKCFFIKQRPKTVGDIGDFSTLRYEDQQKLEEKIASGGSGAVLPTKGKGKKRSKDAQGLKDFSIEYAKSSRAACRGCEQKIAKGEVRISKIVFDTEIGMKYGGQALWHHIECFSKMRDELEYFESGDLLPGFKSLSKEDKAEVLKHIPKVEQKDLPPVKKMKAEPKDEVDKAEDNAKEKTLKEQSKIMYKYRDSLKRHLKKSEMISLLERNEQEVPSGEDRILDRLSDIMTFGALEPCDECKGQFVFDNNGYICRGDLTEWTKCKKSVLEPKRKPFVVPEDLKEEHSFLNKYKYKPMTRAIKYIVASVTAKKIKKSDEEEKPKVDRAPPPLKNMEFVIIGKLVRPKEELKSFIVKMGGKVGTKVHDKVSAVVATKEDVEKMGSRMQTAKELGIQVIPEDYFDDIKDGGAVSYITTMSLCDWGTDPRNRIPTDVEKSKKSKSIYTKSAPSTVTLKLKAGGAVDPDSELQDIAHIYKKGSDVFNVVLGKTDIQTDKNSYYKLQVLQSDSGHRYWVFRSWGRIGTTIGGTKVENFGKDLAAALENFYTVYEEKTGNQWFNRENFKKVPNRFYPVDVDYGEDEVIQKLDSTDIKSDLQQPIQDLVKMLFDVDTMKKAMLEFELDMEKMPLGKLSKKQIQLAYSVLTEISELIKTKAIESKFIDASNRFYTIIPHDFGVEAPIILDSEEQLKTKTEMLDNLLEIELAYSLLKSEDANKDGKSPIDTHYKQLKTDMTILDRESEQFSLLEKYVKNTHAETHSQYDLEIQQIFKIKREKEDRRYKPFRKLHNRKLLWHGSRFTNFVGILSQGLRIAPPEAPTTGYMFGKGIYFADMVSKSANYCCTSVNNPVGLMLLCEVALGDMLECKDAKYITKLPADKHSCKGVGRTYPDDKMSHKREDGVELPLGKPVTNDQLKSSLLYNEDTLSMMLPK